VPFRCILDNVLIYCQANTRNEVQQEPSLSGPQLIKFVDEVLNEERYQDCSDDFKSDLRYSQDFRIIFLKIMID
jgi:hypothetical protein